MQMMLSDVGVDFVFMFVVLFGMVAAFDDGLKTEVYWLSRER